jgi:hypothetical protein
VFGIVAWLTVLWFFLPERIGETLATATGLTGVIFVVSLLSLPQVRPYATRGRVIAFLALLAVLAVVLVRR